jgi:ABC-type nitrate/sulfonate/bicarbonate transport system substrate-binding protein
MNFLRHQYLQLARRVMTLVAVSSLSITVTSTAIGQTRTAIAFPEAIGSWITPLFVAKQQEMFRKRNIEMDLVPAAGASVPRVSEAVPFGLVGAPAALIQAAHGTDLKLIASFSRARLTGRLVARPGIATADELRGRRVGVRVIGAGIWIETVIALRQLQLDPKAVEFIAVGGPPEILNALEAGNIDAALLPERLSEALKAKGYTVLLDQYPPNLYVYEAGLIVTSKYLSSHADVVSGTLDAMIEAVRFMHQPQNKDAAVQALGLALNLPNEQAEQRYNELKDVPEIPQPSIETLKTMQTLMSYHDPAVLDVKIENLVETRFLNQIDSAH